MAFPSDPFEQHGQNRERHIGHNCLRRGKCSPAVQILPCGTPLHGHPHSRPADEHTRSRKPLIIQQWQGKSENQGCIHLGICLRRNCSENSGSSGQAGSHRNPFRPAQQRRRQGTIGKEAQGRIHQFQRRGCHRPGKKSCRFAGRSDEGQDRNQVG